MRRVIVLGSTGSIGTQALEVIRANPRRFDVVGLSAHSSRDALSAQAEAFGVEHTALGAEEAAQLVHDVEADVVLNGITGSVGLGPTLATLATGTTLALANKESLIVGGDLVRRAARPGQIVPVDSEHSAIAQALRSGERAEVRRLVLTASGGPFRGRSRSDMATVTPREALAHPTWDMGRVVTTNSATLVNKGLEVIEAHLLFEVPFEHIDVVVHPQSIVHSMVEFVDGSTIAQASPPDMRLPISLGLDWPHRVGGVGAPLDWTSATSWTFEPLDDDAFRPSGWPSRSVVRDRPSPRCSMRRTSRPLTRSTTARSLSPTSSRRSPPWSMRTSLRRSSRSRPSPRPSAGRVRRRIAPSPRPESARRAQRVGVRCAVVGVGHGPARFGHRPSPVAQSAAGELASRIRCAHAADVAVVLVAGPGPQDRIAVAAELAGLADGALRR